MATYYWVGGDGTWDATDTTHWATSIGGAGGAGVPTSADNAEFNALSNATAYAVNVGANAVAADITIAGPASGNVTITSGATAVINCYGSWSNAATGVAFTSTAGSQINFLATTTGKTITTNNVTLSTLIVRLSGSGGGWTLGSAFTSNTTFFIDAGSFSTSVSNYAMTVTQLAATGTATRTVSFNASTITGTSATTIGFSGTGITLNAGTSTIVGSASSPTFIGGGLTYYNVNFTAVTTGTTTITGANTFNNLTQTSRSATGQRIVSLAADQTVTGTLTLQTLGTPNPVVRTVVWSSVIGTRRTITAAALSGMADVDFRDIEGAGAASWTGTRIGNLLNNTGITFTTGANKYWVLAAGGLWNSSSAWALTPGGAPAAANFPLAQDTINIDLTTVTTGSTISISLAWQIPTIICTRASGSNTLILATTASPFLYGSWTSCSGMSFTGTSVFEFVGQGLTQTVTSAGIPFTQGFNVSSVTGTVLLADAFTTSALVSHVSGTLSLNNYTLTSSTFTAAGTLTKAISFGTGNITVTGTGTVFVGSTAMTVTGTPLIVCTDSSAAARTVNVGPGTEANAISCNVTAGIGQLTLQSNSSFKDINLTGFSGSLATSNPDIYGNFVASSTMTMVSGSSGTLAFKATSGIKTINTNGVSFERNFTFNGVGGAWQLQGALTLGSTRTANVAAGSLSLNNYTLTAGAFNSNNANTRTITFGTGSIVVTDTPWNTTDVTNLTTDASGTISMSSASAKTFNGGDGTWSKLLNSGAGALTITGTNTFMELGNSVSPTSFVFPASTTTSAYAYSINGTESNLVSLRSSNPGTKYTLAKL